MDQIPNDGLANANVFGDGQHLSFDDNLFPAAADQAFTDASWGINASAYQQPGSRAVSTHNVPSWPQPASHVSASNTPVNFHGQSNVYGQPPLQRPASFAQSNSYGGFPNASYNNFAQQQYPHHVQQQTIDPAFQQHQPQQQYNTTTASPVAITPQPLAPVDHSQAQASKQRPQANFSFPVQSQQPPAHTAAHVQPAAGQSDLIQAIPTSEQNGRFMTVDYPALVKATGSERLAPFATIGKNPHEFPVNRSTALPAFAKRNSRNELKRKFKDDPKLQAKLSSKISLSDRSSNASTKSNSASSPKVDAIKYESDSDSDSDSDVSLYSDEEDDLAGAPLPSKRPEDSAKGAVEYDTIKALWRNRRKTIDASSIRKGLGDFWEVVKTIRDRWKADTQAVQDAEAKKRVGDLALLKGRVKDQRDMLEVAFRAALKHGFKSIIEL